MYVLSFMLWKSKLIEVNPRSEFVTALYWQKIIEAEWRIYASVD